MEPATKRVRPAAPPPPPLAPHPQAAACGEDRLSALDDGTLHVILGRVPLRDAAATTVLSRRWPRVFATLPRLLLRGATFTRRSFPDEGYQDYCEDSRRWLDALRSVLDGRAAPVAAFDINFNMGLYDDWFAGVFAEICGSGGLLELSLVNAKYTECYHLPTPFYRCATLTSLDLFNWRLKVPGRITGLRAVRLLRLRCVSATDDDLRRLITRCSSVERLEIDNVHKARSVVINNAPCLEKLLIYSHRPLRVSVNKAPRLDVVRLSFRYSHAEFTWSREDTMDSDVDYSFSEVDELLDYKKMAKREHKRTDEIGNMVTFLSGIGSAKKLHLSPGIYEDFSRGKVSMPKVLPKRKCLFGLETLILALDHNHEVFATLVSCLLNSSPNLKHLIMVDSRYFFHVENEGYTPTDEDSCYSRTSPVWPLPAEYWKEQIDADNVLNHLSSVTFFINSIFEGQLCGGFCQFLVTNARVLKKISIMYYRGDVKPEDAAKLEAIRREIQLWPRASPDLRVELCPHERYTSSILDSD